MIGTDRSADTERFRSAVARRLGLRFEDTKMEFLADVLRRRLAVSRLLPDAYLARLDTETPADEAGALAQELTVPETYFFRNRDQYRAFVETALPRCLAAQSIAKRLRILSAGCASGEEAYSVAILIREAVDPSWDVSILGVDLNPAIVRKATLARYSAWALRETPAHVQQRWFTPEGRDFMLDDGLRGDVTFAVRNLAQDDPQLWSPDAYDIVFCRNVLMYFTRETAQATMARIAGALKPGGYLFLGEAETLRGLSNDFHLQQTHETFYYQRKGRPESSLRPSTVVAPSWTLAPTVVAAVEGDDAWVDMIRRATERIETLTCAPQPLASSGQDSRPLDPTPVWGLEETLDLLHEERFAEALEMMQRLPPESGRKPDVLLLTAALLTHLGRLADAEEACKQLLDVDESAGAHYLLALCRESARDRTSAVYHDQVAIYLDPSFAMPHLHLGLLARRAGDCATAQRELGQALLLLQHEDGPRVLLFGGGFGREMLVEMCRTELAGCGGQP